jgi:hypothetical protein
METFIKAVFIKENWMDLEHLIGLMVIVIKVYGKIIKNQEKAYIFLMIN